MPIPLSNLDNRTFDDLVKELQALIPRYSPDWTDHNASDPGIMLIELFAWVTEILLYRINRIPQEGEQVLLRLLGNTGSAAIDQARAATMQALQGRWRAVTAADFEQLVLGQYPSVARARCLADVAADPADPSVLTGKTGHVSVIIVPYPQNGESKPLPAATLIDDVFSFLDQRRLVTCRHHVVGPVYTDIAVGAVVVCNLGPKPDDVKGMIIENLKNFFSPVGDDNEGESGGWPFGRDVYESEVCAVIEETAGVDHIESLALFRKNGQAWVGGGNKIVIAPNSLVHFDDSLAQTLISGA